MNFALEASGNAHQFYLALTTVTPYKKSIVLSILSRVLTHNPRTCEVLYQCIGSTSVVIERDHESFLVTDFPVSRT